MRLEENYGPDITRDEELAEEIRLYDLHQQHEEAERDRRRWRANYRRYLSTSDEPRAA